MNTIVFASRKGGSGKSTLAAHMASFASRSRRCLLVDADPQGSLTLWRSLRQGEQPELKTAVRGVEGILRAAKEDGVEWVFMDTPPTMSGIVEEAIRAATLVVIPARPSVFDLAAVRDTIAFCRERRRPYAVVINGAPAKRGDAESPIVTAAREQLEKSRIPVWGGQITNRTFYSLALAEGEGAREYAPESLAAAEMGRLWNAIEKSVKAIRGAYDGAVMHKQAA